MFVLEFDRRYYLENSHNGPKKGIKVLAVSDGISAVRPQCELTAKEMHAENARNKKKKKEHNYPTTIKVLKGEKDCEGPILLHKTLNSHFTDTFMSISGYR